MTGQVRTVDGRVAGRRGQATRQKLLDCLSEMLKSSPYRDVKVIDVARKAGTSPATFYQYFPDVEGAVLELAEEVAQEGTGSLTGLVAGRSWAGKSGRQTAEELVDGFLTFWRRNDAILRVIDLGAAEGDKRFNKIRMKILNSVTGSLTETVKDLQAKGRIDQDISAAAMAGSVVIMLAAVASHQKGFSGWGVRQNELKPNLTVLVHLGITGRKPAK
ncbi:MULTISPECIES: TetR family transcriptional regulator [Streptomyces]|uniref:TetR/AcrR family transcriptional regulator n=2 Tax=Streptomyces TaxID=1883 RepID=A0A3M8EY08_9ACTN|nr:MULTISPECIES: TetR family transcriptional regulator [Streptomyces]KNE78677.1 TetR family transcriptional regulator [Streptomyces fradiae]OFA39095.1 TetR family transcriptional regulator [Streptomyces fradiae]PQM20774.1 TetR/AcrR family transcriptional regulator [Streptomyces xinghaiensis]RKM95908.1 TetR/AcrR family transcriptional regulator [Streptomyces xinghaiensis]RNC70889.1 TetR/AcrR family transcriptional regulator [Streptomyces xinghaiensis]